jgi:hypothetical protein
MTAQNKRDAKRIIHNIDNSLKITPSHALNKVAKALATQYNIPKKLMLKTMRSYARVHLSRRTPVQFRYDAPFNPEFLGAQRPRLGEDY